MFFIKHNATNTNDTYNVTKNIDFYIYIYIYIVTVNSYCTKNQ